MNLYLLRHAKSSWESYEDDHDRVLSERGRNDASTLGEYLHKNNINFEIHFVHLHREPERQYPLLIQFPLIRLMR